VGYRVNSTLHVLFSLVNDECISSVLVGTLVAHYANLCRSSQQPRNERTGRPTYPFNGSKASKLALEIRFLDIIAESGHKQRLVRITTNLRISLRLVCGYLALARRNFSQKNTIAVRK
jgi:hypothetical protein